MAELDPMAATHQAINAAHRRMKEVQTAMHAKLVTRPAIPVSDNPDEVLAEHELGVDQRRRDFLTLRHDADLIWADIDYEARNFTQKGLLPRRTVQRLLDGLREFGNE